MVRYNFLRGYECPRCDADTEIFTDPGTGTYGWICPEEGCQAIGFGFGSRRQARIGLREYRERFVDGDRTSR